MSSQRILFVALAVIPLAGCASISTMTTARTLNQHEHQFFAAFEVAGSPDKKLQKVVNGALEWEIGARYGLTDRVELGLRIFTAGAQLEPKFALLRAPSNESGVDLALAPSVGFTNFYMSGGDMAGAVHHNTIYGVLPLLFGGNFAGGHQLVIGAKLMDWELLPDGTGDSPRPANAVYLAASLGFGIQATRWLRIIPEISFAYPLAVSSKDIPHGGFDVGQPIIQGGIGLVFGGYGIH